ncbi:aminotransferase class III-fold pyridoxal phosphate-dependent enzyme [Sphingomonas sp. AP4-R1]|uniref:aminotransferase class III-fold pyridoxal phosphate-dependent enzyme n=1 Tax=Sphingomonas sp. AP4-R1 TaxID=2735134 RepID=UPI0020A487CB|nr:aminotransferase class III-fold pyridoxal phosphate-dependent enzyme [Sphingomonas sp. AP4-R1]
MIVERVAGSTKVLIAPKKCLERLYEITQRHGIILIFAEVITAFGRIRAASAAEAFGITADFFFCTKGLAYGAARPPVADRVGAHQVKATGFVVHKQRSSSPREADSIAFCRKTCGAVEERNSLESRLARRGSIFEQVGQRQ